MWERLKKQTEKLVETSTEVQEPVTAKAIALKISGEQEQVEKIEEVFLQYSKRTLALACDFFVSGIKSFGTVFLIPPLMFSFDCYWTGSQGTPGKNLFSLRVTDANGQKCSDERVFVRTVLKYIVLTTVFYGWFSVHSPFWFLLLVTYRRRTIYDWISGTCVRGKEKNAEKAFSPRPNYFIFAALVLLAVGTSCFQFQVAHQLLGIVNPLAPGFTDPVVRFLAETEIRSIDLDARPRRDFARIDRLAELQQIVATPGTLSLNRLVTLLRGYQVSKEAHNESFRVRYLGLIFQYRRSEVEQLLSQLTSFDLYSTEHLMVEACTDAGKLDDGALLIKKMIRDNAGDSSRMIGINSLINELYRASKGRANAVLLRSILLEETGGLGSRDDWYYRKQVIAQQIFDLQVLHKNQEAAELASQAEQIEKRLKADDERYMEECWERSEAERALKKNNAP